MSLIGHVLDWRGGAVEESWQPWFGIQHVDDWNRQEMIGEYKFAYLQVARHVYKGVYIQQTIDERFIALYHIVYTCACKCLYSYV